jgi:hypothetical protein
MGHGDAIHASHQAQKGWPCARFVISRTGPRVRWELARGRKRKGIGGGENLATSPTLSSQPSMSLLLPFPRPRLLQQVGKMVTSARVWGRPSELLHCRASIPGDFPFPSPPLSLSRVSNLSLPSLILSLTTSLLALAQLELLLPLPRCSARGAWGAGEAATSSP